MSHTSRAKRGSLVAITVEEAEPLLSVIWSEIDYCVIGPDNTHGIFRLSTPMQELQRKRVQVIVEVSVSVPYI